MVIKNKLTIEEANLEKKAIITCLKNQSKELRTILAHAKLNNGYSLLGFKSFEAYLKDCIAIAQIDMKPDYARKCANAGIVEMHILGEDKIGTMREAVLRVFYENIPKPHWKKVFELAKENSRKPSMYRLLTSKQIIETAISLEVYKKKETKSKENVKEKNTNIRTSNKSLLINGVKGSSKKTFNTGKHNNTNIDIDPDNKVSTSNPSNAKVVSLKSFTSDKVSEHLIKKYQETKIRDIVGVLRISQDEIIQDCCNDILTHYKEGTIKNIINKLSRHLQDAKKKPKGNAG
jgi:hypothetical protein